MVHTTHLMGAALTLAVGMAASASANSVTVALTGMPQYRIFDTSTDGGTTYHRTSAGALEWKRSDSLGGAPVGAFETLCIELTQKVGYGKYNYDLVNLEDAPTLGGATASGELTKSDLLRELWGRHARDVVDANTSAAFQLAAWEVVYDEVRNSDASLNLHKSLDLKDGSFRVKEPIANQPYLTTAQNWLWELDGQGPKECLMAMTNSRYQDQVVQIPLPGAAWAGIALLATMAAIRLKKTMAER
jgi:hypothetical protein